MSIRFDSAGEGYTRALSGLSITSFTYCGWAHVLAANGGYAIMFGSHNGANQADVFVNWSNTVDGVTAGSYRGGGGGGNLFAGDGTFPAIGEDFFIAVRSGGSGLELRWRKPGESSWHSATTPYVGTATLAGTLRINTDAFGSWGNRRQGAFYIFDTALSDAELLAQMGQLAPIKAAWGFYPFNDATVANNALDQSGNARHLTSSGTLSVETNVPPSYSAPSDPKEALAAAGAASIVGEVGIAAASAHVMALAAAGAVVIAGFVPIASVSVSALASSGVIQIGGAVPIATTSSAVVALAGSGAAQLVGAVPVALFSDHVFALAADAAMILAQGMSGVAFVALPAPILRPDKKRVARFGAETRALHFGKESRHVTIRREARSVRIARETRDV